MKRLKSTKKPNPYTKSIRIVFRVDSEEMRLILSKSHAFTEGNVSEFARFAVLNWKPKKEDFQK